MRAQTIAAFAPALLLAACSKSAPPEPAAVSSASPAGSAAPAGAAATPVGIPLDADKVAAVVNGKHQKPYAGPTGTLKGTVRIEGDPPPDTNLKFPAKCRESTATYGKLFRVGLDHALGDALVAVTGYEGYVPAASDVAKAVVHGCAALQRTYVLTFGQRLEVANLGPEPVLPYLDGSKIASIMIAVPEGDPVKLSPMQPGRYMLRDKLETGMIADVFVLKFATVAVTGLDGQYEIKGIPAGKVKVNVDLPVIHKAEEKDVEIKEGDNTLDFTLKFDASKDDPAARAPAAGSASASAPAAAPPKGAPKGK
jgi:hypothetical protein